MDHNPKAFLFDIRQACEEIEDFTRGISLAEYSENPIVRAAVERKLMVIGEAMVRLRREHPEILDRITAYEQIIGLRNVLAHGYDIIEDSTVWSAVKDSLPILRSEIEEILKG
ncbi:MAG: HepT-like ribonuclease domain-containing protein [bacterium]